MPISEPMQSPIQEPFPGETLLKFRGDYLSFQLRIRGEGQAFLRTNIGQGHLVRLETIELVENKRQKMGEDWFDWPMTSLGNGQYKITLPLLEVGHFQAKTFFVPNGSKRVAWPDGANISINVESEKYRDGNGIYCAFVRQFGPNKYNSKTWSRPTDDQEHCIQALENKHYAVIPPSGTFRDLIRELDHIFIKLRCKILHLLPVHPTPTVFGRMGRFGSPYAALDFLGVDPALAEFDTKLTPLDQFQELVDGVHAREGRLFLDIALNHTGWASKLHETHPEWMRRDEDGSFHRPGAWGVTWSDLTELEHHRGDLWLYLAEVLITWCERGVDGFRCDAGYMIPKEAWSYLVSKVRERFPDTVFLLEGLGGDPRITENLLNDVNLNWAYSELFQNYSKHEISSYMQHAWPLSQKIGFYVHYAETHDNQRLASSSKAYSRMRVGLCALLSPNGAFGFANGVEWFATEKIDVHRDSGLNWGHEDQQVEWIGALNHLLSTHSCFKHGSSLEFLDGFHPDLLAFKRFDCEKNETILCVINLSSNERVTTEVAFVSSMRFFKDFEGAATEKGGGQYLIPPFGFLCLGNPVLIHDSDQACSIAATLEAVSYFLPLPSVGEKDPKQLADGFYRDPVGFCSQFGKVSLWCADHDPARDFILPIDHCLIVKSEHRFKAEFLSVMRESTRSKSGSWYATFPPLIESTESSMAVNRSQIEHLSMEIYCDKHVRRVLGRIWQANPSTFLELGYDSGLGNNERDELIFLDTNQRGGMLRAHIEWGRLASRYDALLAANLSKDWPVDRHVFLRRWRGWARFRGHSVAFSPDTTEMVFIDDAIRYSFVLPQGTGKWIRMVVTLQLIDKKNLVKTTFYRDPKSERDMLDDDMTVTIILRPDLEDRNFHHVTKAFNGAETQLPARVTQIKDSGFKFMSSTGAIFHVFCEKGLYKSENSWSYNLHYPVESSRGLEDHGDLFSPGYFELELQGGESKVILAGTTEDMSGFRTGSTEQGEGICVPSQDLIQKSRQVSWRPFPVFREGEDFGADLLKAMEHFIVKRGKRQTVIAGYPWFLDWGRDTLICARGMIAAGFTTEVEEILLQFGAFAERGTLPNMIHGKDASNRDTSDAPLWYFRVCQDLCAKRGSQDFLYKLVDDSRTVLQVLVEIAEGYVQGTSNGIFVEPESGMVFSPSHFTWMDTNYPAGTPRMGYPVEIQALWYQALVFLGSVTEESKWRDLAARLKKGFVELFWLEEKGYFADCIRAQPGQKPSQGLAEDALRPNQLFAILFGLTEGDHAVRALQASKKLIVPGGIRSLADAEVQVPLPVYNKDHELLNDPQRPFWPHYQGPEDSRRKPAYHNGTVWTWPFPMFCECILLVHGSASQSDALAYLLSSAKHFYSGCLGQMPEILDGQSPHLQRGCDAQAWSVTELYRVWDLLK